MQHQRMWYPERAACYHMQTCYYIWQDGMNLGGMAGNEIGLGLAEISEVGIQNLGSMAGNIWTCQDSKINSAWQGVQRACQDSKIMAAWQEIVVLAKTSESGIRNHGGMARFAEGLPRFQNLGSVARHSLPCNTSESDIQNLGGMARKCWHAKTSESGIQNGGMARFTECLTRF